MKSGRGGARKGAGRKPALDKKVTTTISLRRADWDYLDNIGPSRGRAVELLINKERGNG